jgi:Iap family predicted aminopeptidase
VIRTLDTANATAVIFESVTPGEVYGMIVSPIWGTPSAENASGLPDLPVAEVYPEDGQWLRETAAGDDVELTVYTRTITELTTLPCPIGQIAGTDSDRYLLIGNHIDSWHEGVTDNGTAAAASLEIARVFAENPPKRGVRFGFWPGHSMVGTQGARGTRTNTG